MKAQFLKMAGVNSEEEFYNMYPTEEAFFQVYPEARQMAHGGQPYPWSYPEYGMQGKGAGAQIPVETYYAYGGASNGPLGYFDDGGSPFNYGQFPAFAKKGNQVQGGGIDSAVSSRLKNFLSGIQANTQKALNDQAMEEAMQMNQELMPQMIAQYGAEMGSRYNPNMYGQNMIQNTLDQLNQENQFATRDFLNMGKFFANNMINNKLSDISDKQKRDMQMEEEIGKDAQTVPGFNPIPENMAKLGGSLKKYQTGAQTGTPNYTSPTPPISDLDINKIIEDTKKAGKNAAQKRKDEAELANIQKLKENRDAAIEKLTKSPEGTYETYFTGPGMGGSGSFISPDLTANSVKYWDDQYKEAYNNYFSSRNIASTTPATQTPGAKTTSTSQCGTGQKWSSLYKICYTPITSNDQYYGGIGNSNKSAEQQAAEKEWTRDPNHLSYYEWLQTQSDTKQPAPASAKPQAKAAAPKAPAKPVAPVKKQITQSDTLGLAAAKKAMGVKKYGGSLNKYNAGGGVKGTSGNFTFYNDGSIINNTTNTWVQDADPNWKPEGVPPMKYEGTEQPTEKTTGTTTTTTSGDITDPKEKAVRDLAIAYGQDPDQTWTQYQALMNYGTMGAGTQQPYGYGVSSMVPYRYRHRGYGPIGWDRGYVPGDLDLRAMEEQAMKMGYDFYGKSRPTLFGGRKVVIKTHYNPNTGKVENKPAIESTTPEKDISKYTQWTEPVEDTTPPPSNVYAPSVPEFNSGKLPPLDDASQYTPTEDNTGFPIIPFYPNTGTLTEDNAGYPTVTYAHGGGLSKFLPKHQVMGETGFKFDNLDINIPIMDTIHNIGEKYQHGLTSIKDFNQERKQKRDERRGTDEKAVWKTGPSPYAADTILTSMAFASNLGRGKERKALEDKLANKMSSDYMFTAVGKNKGDYVPTGQTYGEFRPNQKTPTFDTGYQRGNANRPYYGGFDKGGSPGYSDWSQTPINGYYGVPTGEMTMYPHWTQAPVMQMGGAPSTEQYLTDEEIAEIIQMGGQVEYLD